MFIQKSFKKYYFMEILSALISKLNLIGWKGNNNNLYSDYFVIDKKFSFNEKEFIVDMAFYIYQVDYPIAIMEFSNNLSSVNKEKRLIYLANKLNCPIIIIANDEKCRYKVLNKDIDVIEDIINITPLKLSVLFSSYIIEKCNVDLTNPQIEFIKNNNTSKIHKFYNQSIQQNCLIAKVYSEIYNNNYSIPEYGYIYYIVNELGEVIKITSNEYDIDKYYKFSIFLFDSSLRK